MWNKCNNKMRISLRFHSSQCKHRRLWRLAVATQPPIAECQSVPLRGTHLDYHMYPQLRCFAACSGFHDIGPASRNLLIILDWSCLWVREESKLKNSEKRHIVGGAKRKANARGSYSLLCKSLTLAQILTFDLHLCVFFVFSACAFRERRQPLIPLWHVWAWELVLISPYMS